MSSRIGARFSIQSNKTTAWVQVAFLPRGNDEPPLDVSKIRVRYRVDLGPGADAQRPRELRPKALISAAECLFTVQLPSLAEHPEARLVIWAFQYQEDDADGKGAMYLGKMVSRLNRFP